MAFTRKALKGMNLSDDVVDALIEMHVESTEVIKADRDKFKADAEKLQIVQKKLDELEAAGDGGYKEKYEKEHADFEKYKADQTAKETKASKEKAVRAFFESKGIKGKNLEIAIRASHAEIDGIEMDGEKIKDSSALESLVSGDLSHMVETSTTTGASTSTPPANNQSGGEDPSRMTMEQYIAYRNNN